MDIVTVLLVAVALAMDAFAVALSTGAYLRKADRRQTFRLSFHFGFFQFMMPIIGWLAGSQIVQIVGMFDHWIALALLCVIGGKMIHASLSSATGGIKTDVTRGSALIALSIATSVDAFAVGLSIAVMQTDIIFPSIMIGIVAGSMTVIGLRLGEHFSMRLGRKMEFIGGLVLIGIGIRILLEHLDILGSLT